jgi:predicted NAD-dependent protein-ADP-ribosyltransferase YbiA (DUF1768 family)
MADKRKVRERVWQDKTSSDEEGPPPAKAPRQVKALRMIDGKVAVPFNARGGRDTRILSNLATVEGGLTVTFISGKPLVFTSVEAAYVLIKIFGLNDEHVRHFTDGGVFSSFEAYQEFVNKNPDVALNVKPESWENAVGILSKVVGGKSKQAKLLRKRLDMPEPKKEKFDEKNDKPLWRMLHQAKFDASAAFQDCLKKTSENYLYEFDRSSGNLKQLESFWGGCFLPDGTFRGKNVMGEMLMELRNLVLTPDPQTPPSPRTPHPQTPPSPRTPHPQTPPSPYVRCP